MRIKQLTQTDNFKISIKIKIKNAKCLHKRVYICGSLLCHLRAGSFLHHFITPCGLLLFRSIGLPMGNSFTYLGRFRHYAGRDIPHQQERLGERCSSSACSEQLPPSVWSSPIRTYPAEWHPPFISCIRWPWHWP